MASSSRRKMALKELLFPQMSLHLLCDDDQSKSGMTPERQEISRLVKSRMQNLGLPLHDYGKQEFCFHLASVANRLRWYHLPRLSITTLIELPFGSRLFPDEASDKRNSFSYVIINPSYDLKLEPDDIM